MLRTMAGVGGVRKSMTQPPTAAESQFAMGRWSHIHLADASGSQGRSLDRPSPCADSGAPAFSFDGGRLGFVCTSSVGVYGVYVIELSTGAVRSLASLQGDPQGRAWTPAGDALIVVSES